MNPCRTSLVSFFGGLSVYFGALIGLLVLEHNLTMAWLVPGILLLVGGFLLGLGLCRDLRTTVKRVDQKAIATRMLPLTHDASYALSLACRSSHMPHRR